MSAYAGSLHTICRVVFWVFRFDQILVIALYFALHFDQIPSCTQYRRNLFYFQASNEFQPFFNTDQLSCRPSQDGETALFVFKDVSSDSLLNYDNIDISGTETFDLWLTTKEQALTNELDYYTECILGNINLQNNTIQLLIPEPATATMSLLGLTALMVRRKRK